MDTETDKLTSEPLNLYEYALARARESADRGELPKVARESGVGYWWLGKFASGKIPGASYEKVDRLARYYLSLPPPPELPAIEPRATG